MSEHDVPAERGRDELRERATKLAQGYLNYPQSVMLRDAIVALFDDLLAPQEAPAEGISLSAQLSQAAAWMRVWDECQRLGMDTYGAPSTSTGLDIVLDFIRGRAAPQEAPPILSRKHADEIAYFLRRPDMAHDAKRERLASLVERAGAVTCPCGGGPGHGDAWCCDYECPTCGRGPKLDEAIFQAGLERGRADMAPAEAKEPSAPGSATWGDVRSGLRAELLAEGLDSAAADRLARKVVHRFAFTASGEPSGAADGVVRRTSVAPVASYGWSGSGAEAVVREAYEVIDELAPQWSGSSIATVLRAYLEHAKDAPEELASDGIGGHTDGVDSR